jgi:hypothetical protein
LKCRKIPKKKRPELSTGKISQAIATIRGNAFFCKLGFAARAVGLGEVEADGVSSWVLTVLWSLVSKLSVR